MKSRLHFIHGTGTISRCAEFIETLEDDIKEEKEKQKIQNFESLRYVIASF